MMWLTLRERVTLTIVGISLVAGIGLRVWQQQRSPIAVRMGVAPSEAASWDAQLAQARQIDVNHAALEELERLPSIGPVVAQRILNYRQAHGPFQRVDDLLAVPGIGPKTLEGFREYVRVQ